MKATKAIALLFVALLGCTLASASSSSSSSSSSGSVIAPSSSSSSPVVPTSSSSSVAPVVVSSSSSVAPVLTSSSSSPVPIASSSSSSSVGGGVISSSSSSSVVTPVSEVSSDAECAPFEIQCVKYDKTCTDDLYHNPACMEGCCPYDYFCVHSECITDNNGDACDGTPGNCTVALWGTGVVECVDKECKELLNCGDTCDKDEDCANGMYCHKSKCHENDNSTCVSVVDQYPQWVIYGQDCDAGHYCDATKKCVATTERKENCTFGVTVCEMNSVCDPITKTCVKLFDKEEDEDCDTRALYTCSEKTYCKANAGTTVGKCTKAIKDEYKDCDTNDDCVSDDFGNRTCECLNNGKKYCMPQQDFQQAPCASSLKNVYKCFGDNKCSTGVISQNEDSCSQIYCAQEISDYRTCLLCEQYDLGSCLSSKEEDRYCPAAQLETWEKLTILAVIVVVVIVIIVVITACCCCSKRNDYQQVA
eukprot:TRINITY_DN235_c0_g1_i1.p1 TRINITY_DN235_c0_g1~~TRINITY_DN235_c0_g1_i1.p1  ORF type:complete len:476 (+),score=142.57 TRINITY_DN235_c0_g1_i1:62-1489(+)